MYVALKCVIEHYFEIISEDYMPLMDGLSIFISEQQKHDGDDD